MTRRLCLLVLFILSLTPLACAQTLIANGDFEAGITGWEPVAAEGASVSLSTDKPAQGKSCLQLQTTGKSPAWVLSPTLTGPGVGQVALLSFSARRHAGQSRLALDIVGAAGELSEAVIWEAALPEDDKWHKVALLLRVPPVGEAAPRLAFAAIGAAGAWALDEVNVTTGSVPTATIQPLPGSPAVTDRLAADWQPEGYLDAKAQQVGSELELALTVNGLWITVRPSLTCFRSFREGAVVYCANRGAIDKELTIRVEAPEGVEAPAWTVPIKGDGTTRFHVAFQCLRQGEFNTRVTFSSGADTAAVPIKITSRRCYPSLGLRWEEPLTADLVAQLPRLPFDTHLLVCPADLVGLQTLAQPLQALGADLLIAPEAPGLSDTQFAAVLGELGGQFDPSFWIPYVRPGLNPLNAATAAARFAAVQRAKVRNAGVLSPPIQLRRTWPDGKLAPERPELLSADRTAGLMAITIRPPRLGAPCVLGEQVDGQAGTISGAMSSLSRQADLSSLRQLLGERQINLPLLVDGIQARSSGNERLDALYLARALTLALYQGSTGVLLAPHREAANGFGVLASPNTESQPGPIQQTLQAIAQELGGATPVVALAASDAVSLNHTAAVGFRPFLRGGEGILVLWNNTGISRDVALEFRSQPVVGQYVRLAYQGDFLQRTWDPIFKFGEEAFVRKLPMMVTRLNPLELQLLSFRLLDPHTAWLRSVDLAKPYVAPKDTMPPVREDWWQDMLKAQPLPQ